MEEPLSEQPKPSNSKAFYGRVSKFSKVSTAMAAPDDGNGVDRLDFGVR